MFFDSFLGTYILMVLVGSFVYVVGSAFLTMLTFGIWLNFALDPWFAGWVIMGTPLCFLVLGLLPEPFEAPIAIFPVLLWVVVTAGVGCNVAVNSLPW